MTDAWDDEDRAIARALGVEIPDRAGVGADEPTKVADYENVVAQFPFDPVAPGADLEDRVLAAALARRPASVRAIDSGPSRRAARRTLPIRWMVAGGSAVAAAVIVVVLTVSRPAPNGGAAARIQPAAAGASVASVLAEPGARSGELRTSATASGGQVVLAPDGQGYLYNLTLAPARGADWLWLDTAAGPARVGRMPAGPKSVYFVVHGAVGKVTGVFVTSEPASGTPVAPGPVVARSALG